MTPAPEDEEPTGIFVDMSRVTVRDIIKIITTSGSIYAFRKPPGSEKGVFRVIESTNTESIPLESLVKVSPENYIVSNGKRFIFVIEVKKGDEDGHAKTGVKERKDTVYRKITTSPIVEIRRSTLG